MTQCFAAETSLFDRVPQLGMREIKPAEGSRRFVSLLRQVNQGAAPAGLGTPPLRLCSTGERGGEIRRRRRRKTEQLRECNLRSETSFLFPVQPPVVVSVPTTTKL